MTWCNVRGFDSARTVTVQATLLPDGNDRDDITAPASTLGDAIVGLSPGRTGNFAPVNLSDAGPDRRRHGAVGERFAQNAQLDLRRAGEEVLRDASRQLRPARALDRRAASSRDAFAYETTVANEIRGIGVDTYNLSRRFRQRRPAAQLVVMDWLGKYPDNPTQKFLGENNTLSVMGQECGHRWLAFLEFRDHTGQRSRGAARPRPGALELLLRFGRLGHGGQRHRGSRRRLVPDRRRRAALQPARPVRHGSRPGRCGAAVLLRREPDQHVGRCAPDESAPEVGVTFNGTRRDVLIQDVIAILGPRAPSAAESARVHRQAFIYVVSDRQAARVRRDVSKVDNIRRAWEDVLPAGHRPAACRRSRRLH